jgi:MoaA/NifB/PqqE/SkfB family radical SAM enzyme
VKISFDGPRHSHDSMRGAGSFDRAITGARAAREAGVPVEFTCSGGRHNAEALDQLLDIAEGLGSSTIFQPVRNSLFVHGGRDGFAWEQSISQSCDVRPYRSFQTARASGRK